MPFEDRARLVKWIAVVAAGVVAVAVIATVGAVLALRHFDSTRTPRASGSSGTGAATPSAARSASPGAGPATFGAGVRHLNLSRAADRPLPTTVWYPAATAAGTAYQPGSNVPIAAGRFPLVLFSHGLPSLPETYAGLAGRLATAGFVVAAPAYPHTSKYTAFPTMADVPNQPADAFFVIDQVLKLDTTGDDAFAGHLDTARFAAVGHSAGGFTTAGMLATQHDSRLVASVIISGGMLGPFVAPAVDVLFVHGEFDQTISYATGRQAYNAVPWAKCFLTIGGGDHTEFLKPGRAGFEPTVTTMTDFLRAKLSDDAAAGARLMADGWTGGARFEQQGP